MLNEQKSSNIESEDINGYYAQTYGVEVYTRDKPDIPVNELLNNLRNRCGDVEVVKSNEKLLLLMFKDYLVQYEDVQVPTQLAIMITDTIADKDSIYKSIKQSFAINNPKEVIENTKYTVLITDMMAVGLDYYTRIELFQKSLYSVLEVVGCEAINWHSSQQIVDPNLYLKNKPSDEKYNLLLGALNVRLFNVEGKKDEYIMDTLGLSTLGLPDLQCHFKNLEKHDIANLLYTYGGYIFQDGDTIKDGEVIQGVMEDTQYVCKHEMSLLEPKRIVINFKPKE